MTDDAEHKEPTVDVLTATTKENIRRLVRQNEQLQQEAKDLKAELVWTAKLVADQAPGVLHQVLMPSGTYVLERERARYDEIYKGYSIERDRTYSLYFIRSQDDSPAPLSLRQQFTSRDRAKAAIDKFLFEQAKVANA